MTALRTLVATVLVLCFAASQAACAQTAWNTTVASNGGGATIRVAASAGAAIVGAGGNVYAFGLATGAGIWSVAVDDAHTLAVTNDMAVVVGKNSTLTALNAATGNPVWSTTQFTSIAAVVATPNLVVVESKGTVTAVSAATGTMKWSQSVSPSGNSGSLAYKNDILVVSVGSRVAALNLATGALEFTVQTVSTLALASNSAIAGSAAVGFSSESAAVINTTSGMLVMQLTPASGSVTDANLGASGSLFATVQKKGTSAVKCVSASSQSLLWEFSTQDAIAPLSFDGKGNALFATESMFVVLDAASGAQLTGAALANADLAHASASYKGMAYVAAYTSAAHDTIAIIALQYGSS